jgi:glutaminase
MINAGVARRTLAVMAGCGMYDTAGDWLVRVGIPAESGVAAACWEHGRAARPRARTTGVAESVGSADRG